jgi:hypothetical protein
VFCFFDVFPSLLTDIVLGFYNETCICQETSDYRESFIVGMVPTIFQDFRAGRLPTAFQEKQ